MKRLLFSLNRAHLCAKSVARIELDARADLGGCLRQFRSSISFIGCDIGKDPMIAARIFSRKIRSASSAGIFLRWPEGRVGTSEYIKADRSIFVPRVRCAGEAKGQSNVNTSPSTTYSTYPARSFASRHRDFPFAGILGLSEVLQLWWPDTRTPMARR